MKQVALYEPIRKWLENNGFRTLITGEKLTIVLPINDLVPVPYKVPDVIGAREQHVAIVEVEIDRRRFFDALGRCMLWKCTSSFVYLAYPKGSISHAPLLNRLGIGLLAVDVNSQSVEEPVSLPPDGSTLFRVHELHPTDYPKELALAERIRASLGS